MSQRIGDYQVLAELGRGGMGLVLLVERAGRRYALKLLAPGADGLDWARFAQEAQALARLGHPHIAGLVEVVRRAEGPPALVLEYVPGQSLAQRLRQGPLPAQEAARVARELSLALVHAHALGVSHRDIKPANVLLGGDGLTRLIDFGIARLTDGLPLTRTGELLGTPEYMAPELASAAGRSGGVGPAADVWGVGAVLYAMLCGRPPFVGGSVLEVLLAVATAPIIRPARLAPDVDPGLEAVCLRCLERDPGERYPSAAALVAALADCERDLAAPPGPRRRGRGALALALALAAGVAVGLTLERREVPAPGPASDPSATSAAPGSPAPAPSVDAVALLRGIAGEMARSGDYAGARRRLEAALSEDPAVARFWMELGTARANTQDPGGAEQAFARALAIDDRDPEIWSARADARNKAGAYDQAIACAGRAIELAPRLAAAYVNRGFARVRLRDLTAAVSDFAQARALQPSSSNARFNLAYVLLELQRYDEALPELDQLILAAGDRADADLWMRRAIARANAAGKDLRGAASDLREAGLRGRGDAWEHAAALLRQLGDSQGELEAVRRLVALHPEHERWRARLAELDPR
ncbi:MAG: protein kinase [Planctomycetota bacterium]